MPIVAVEFYAMKESRYFIGIDLGTSNCAVSYLDRNEQNPQTKTFFIPQLDSAETRNPYDILPSFLVASENHTSSSARSFIPGVFARKKIAEVPDQVIHSAKSWLCHKGIDRRSKILPWHSRSIQDSDKLSPIQASSAYLDYIKYAWDQSFAFNDTSSEFCKQEVVVTVPASFDNVAQKLTLEACKMASFPSNVTLLEEPQAAIYSYLENNGGSSKILELLPELEDRPQTLLVCDIGGGTSDFSLLEALPPDQKTGKIGIRRIAVSDHILLGGDNIDLTLAKHLEQQIENTGHTISTIEWSYLVAQARNIKEKALQDYDNDKKDEVYPVTLLSSGSQLFGNAKSAQLKLQDIISIIEDGFLPECSANATPYIEDGALMEMGLPFAKDSAITKHLSHFLQGRKVNALLFNGGTVSSRKIQSRLSLIIANWQSEQKPKILNNPTPYLAVAHGASYYCWQSRTGIGNLIEAGSARSVYLEIEKRETKTSKRKKKKGLLNEAPHLLCILPYGCKNDETVILEKHLLNLKINQPVEFKPYYSTQREGDLAGDIVQLSDEFKEMSPLQTMVHFNHDSSNGSLQTVKVIIETKLNSVGLMQVFCKTKDDSIQQEKSWELEFNLRSIATNPEDSENLSSFQDLEPEKLKKANTITQGLYPGNGQKADITLKPNGLVKQWETALEQKKKSWSAQTLRHLWEPLSAGISQRYRSLDHEISWLIAAGYTLRPGYGSLGDDMRIRNLLLLRELGIQYSNDKQAREQEMILWRRIAGGLGKEEQQSIFNDFIPFLRELTNQGIEGMRMAASFERIKQEDRLELLNLCIEGILNKNEKFHDVYFWCIGRILSRIPVYTGMESVLQPIEVERAFKQIKKIDWQGNKHLKALHTCLLQSTRITNQRELDINSELRQEIIDKMKDSAADDEILKPIREYVPVEQKDLTILYGEALPAGLVL